jgi:hypothetical protein
MAIDSPPRSKKNAVNQLFLTGGHACFPVYAFSIVLGPGERHKRNLQEMAHGLAGSVAVLASIIGWLVGRLLYSVLDPRVFVISATLTLLVFMLGFAIPPAARDWG